jgi:hypothetical protein
LVALSVNPNFQLIGFLIILLVGQISHLWPHQENGVIFNRIKFGLTPEQREKSPSALRSSGKKFEKYKILPTNT